MRHSRLFIFVLLFIVIPMNSNAEPTKSQTINFIKIKLTEYGGADYISGNTHCEGKYNVDFPTTCSMVIENHWYNDGALRSLTVDTISNMGNIDPTRSEIMDGANNIYIRLYGKEGRKFCTTKCIKSRDGCWEAMHTDFINIEVRNRFQARKIMKALNHLVKLCGGAGELF